MIDVAASSNLRATAEGTAKFKDAFVNTGKLPATAYRVLGRTGLTTSVLGFGCYRIDNEVPEYRLALEKAISEGCNLIDTSTNYGDGDSEKCVGEALQAMTPEKRRGIVVVSKVGYVQGKNLTLAQERQTLGKPFPEMVKYMDGCWHCIHPEFLRDQLDRTLHRLGTKSVDVYLLHNPEYYFSDALHQGQASNIAELRGEFYRRIRNAFAYLEEEVERGRIGWYGVSSNTFVAQAEDAEATSLTTMWDLAESVAKQRTGKADEHHFAVAQMPGNLFEAGFVLEENNGPTRAESVIEFAQSKNVAVLLNRPLNAIMGNKLVRLADFHVVDVGEDAEEQAEKVAQLEQEFIQTIAPHIQTPPDGLPAKDFFRWGGELAQAELDAISLDQWQRLRAQVILPQVDHIIVQMDDFMVGNLGKVWGEWRDRYVGEMHKLLELIEHHSTRHSQALSNEVHRRVAPLVPESAKGLKLSQKALAILAFTPGVTCVLNGMRRREYVTDSMQALRTTPFPVDASLYERLHSQG